MNKVYEKMADNTSGSENKTVSDGASTPNVPTSSPDTDAPRSGAEASALRSGPANALRSGPRPLYWVRAYPNAKPDEVLERERFDEKKTEAERLFHQRELSREELRQLNWVGKPAVAYHQDSDSSIERPVAGRVFQQRYDDQTHSLYLGIRPLDGVRGRFMSANFEDESQPMRNVSLGHRIWRDPKTGERKLSADEVSFCPLALRPNCGIVGIERDVSYPENLNWDEETYKLSEDPSDVIRLAAVKMSTPSPPSGTPPPSGTLPAAPSGASPAAPPSGATPATPGTPANTNGVAPMQDEKSSSSSTGKRTHTQMEADDNDADPYGDLADFLSAQSIDAKQKLKLAKALKDIHDNNATQRKEMEKVYAEKKELESRVARGEMSLKQAERMFLDSLLVLSKDVKRDLPDDMKKFLAQNQDPAAVPLPASDLLWKTGAHALIAQASTEIHSLRQQLDLAQQQRAAAEAQYRPRSYRGRLRTALADSF